MLKADGKYLVALSGGADSVSLLLTLKDLKYNVEAVHCNFHLRGEESDRDETFCKSLCETHGVDFHVVHFDTLAYAQLHKVSIEMAARELRYHYFEQLRHDIDADGICVAHHRDDSVETVLINLIRGTGVHGLCGISPRNGYIIRPLLCVSRSDILDYLSSLQQDYVIDSTNLIDDVMRNKIRLDIIPMLEQINPSVSANIAKTAARVNDAVKIFNKALDDTSCKVVEKKDNNCAISIPLLKEQVSPEYTLFYILKDYGFTPAQIEQIANNLDAESGREWYSNTNVALIDRDNLLIEPIETSTDKQMQIPECGTYVYSEDAKFRFSTVQIGDDFKISKDNDCVSLDADAITFPLVIRHCKTGDRFIPFGMKGSKLVSDYLTDRKMSLFDKRRQLIVTDTDNHILWLVGMRTDNRYRITSSSRSALIISVHKE